ncbi:MAG: translation initiation factor 2 [Desulfovibrionaceae bacterium]|nr:translation initiation factor 2 [Desulfovibrionaceae bacterium]
MNVSKMLTICSLAALMALGGVSCSDSKAPSPEDGTAAQATRAEQAAPASRDKIQAGLEEAGRKLVGMAAENVTPKKSRMTAAKRGKTYVAKYAEVDRSSMSVSMQPGKNGKYVGFIRYAENHYECTGKTKAAALKAQECSVVKTRRMTEMVQYDGRQWRY